MLSDSPLLAPEGAELFLLFPPYPWRLRQTATFLWTAPGWSGSARMSPGQLGRRPAQLTRAGREHRDGRLAPPLPAPSSWTSYLTVLSSPPEDGCNPRVQPGAQWLPARMVMAYECSWSCHCHDKDGKDGDRTPVPGGGSVPKWAAKALGLLSQEVGFSHRRLSIPWPQVALLQTSPQTLGKHGSLRGGRTPWAQGAGLPSTSALPTFGSSNFSVWGQSCAP